MKNKEHLEVLQAEISSIAKGAGISFTGTLIGVGLKYIFELSVARSLGAEFFGIFFLGFSIFKILERVTTLGLNNGVLRYVSLYRGENDTPRIKGTIILSLKVVFATGMVLTIILILFSRDISSRFFPESNLHSILIIFFLGITFTGLTEIMVFSTQAFQIMTYKVLVRSLIEPGASVVLFVGFLIFGWRILGAPLAFVTATIIGTYFAFRYMKKVIPFIMKSTPNSVFETKKILSFSWPLFFVGFFDLTNIHINTLMLGYFRTSEDVGIYGATWRTAFIVPMILISFTSIFAPIISDLYNRKEKKKLENLFKIITKWIFSLSLPISLLMVFFAKKILSFWGSEYKIGAISLIIICLGQLVNCITGPVGFMIMMTGRSKINLINALSSTALVVTLNLFLIPKYGILGAAISLGVVIAVINLVKLIEVYIILKVLPFRLDFFKPVAAGGISLCTLFLTSKFLQNIHHPLLEIALGSTILMGTYVLFLFLFRLAEEDRIILRKIKEKAMIYKRN